MIGVGGGLAIAAFIEINTTLTEFNISNNSIGSVAGLQIANVCVLYCQHSTPCL